ncbi:hypothetical protein ABEB36_007933 [Hypothenemus hampei]|uniref:Rhythmically expressed gene 5 protein n=1 Tax=Hypothenemus hampei TaxID=57062 RepID=A0ABD1EVM0_HYPHA
MTTMKTTTTWSSIFGVLWLCVTLFPHGTSASAIPMWEYLSKQEKTSFIYSLFANQVEKFCEDSIVPLCNRKLLKYGLGTLKNMNDDQLDSMDPYQRDANTIIWETLMTGNRFQKTTPKITRKSTTTSRPNSFEDESFTDYEDAQSNIYILPTPKGFVPQVEKATDGEGVFHRFQNQYRPIEVTTLKPTTSTRKPLLNREVQFIHNPLDGPVVVRVFPDGSPVRERNTQRSEDDDDLRRYRFLKRIPSY